MKKSVSYFRNGLMLSLAFMAVSACDKNDVEKIDEPKSDIENIIGKWQKYQVLDNDNKWIKGDYDEFWVYKSDGTFQNEDGGVIVTIGTYQINGSILTIYSRTLYEPYDVENFSGEFYFNNGYMQYDYFNLETGDKAITLFKKM